MDTHKISIEKLNDFLLKLYNLCKMNIAFITNELNALKNEINEQKLLMKVKYEEILSALEKSNEDSALRFREETQRLTVDHELELSDIRAALNEKNEIIASLNREKEALKIEHQKEIERIEKEHQSTKEILEKTKQEIDEFKKKIEDIELQKQKEIKDLQEKMHIDYKAEIESLRSR